MTDESGLVDDHLPEMLAFMLPMVKRGFSRLVEAIEDFSEAMVVNSLQLMWEDPEECFIWEYNEGLYASDFYDAGGDLDAQRVELTVQPELCSVSKGRLIEVLKQLVLVPNSCFRFGRGTWRIFVKVPGVARGMIDLFPGDTVVPEVRMRVIIGEKIIEPASGLDQLIKSGWADATTAAFKRWALSNSVRIPSDHPSFLQVVEKPCAGAPGVYIVRSQPLPFSPLVNPRLYTSTVDVAVCESVDEIEECEKFYQTPEAFRLKEFPFYSASPPVVSRAARRFVDFVEGSVRLIPVPWAGGRVVTVLLPTRAIMSRLTARGRAKLHRQRYIVTVSNDRETAARELKRTFGIDVRA